MISAGYQTNAWITVRATISRGPAAPRLSRELRTSVESPRMAAEAASRSGSTATTSSASSAIPPSVAAIAAGVGLGVSTWRSIAGSDPGSGAKARGQARVPSTAVVAADRHRQRSRVADKDTGTPRTGDRRVDQRPGQHSRMRAVAGRDHDRHLAALGLVNRDRVGEAQSRRVRVRDRQRPVLGVNIDLLGLGVVGAEEDDRAVHQPEVVRVAGLDQAVSDPEAVAERPPPVGVELPLKALVEGVEPDRA